MTTLYCVYKSSYDLSELENKILMAKKIGFEGIEYIATISDMFFPPKDILSIANKHKVSIKALHIPLIFTIYTPQFLLHNIKKFVDYFPEAQRFNFHLSCFINPLGKQISALKELQNLMKESNLPISCESNPDEYLIFKYFPKETYDPQLFASFCINHNLPINLDTSHIAAWNYDIIDFFQTYHKYINVIHLSDMTDDKQHLPFGKGKLPLKKFFEVLKKKSYKGITTFEVSNFSKDTDREDQIRELKNSFEIFKKYTSS